jgi:HK97 family phage prohead protease
MKNEIRYTAAKELRVQTSADGSKTISGYAAVFNSKSLPLPFTEIIAPGAFTKSLRDSPDVLALRDHDPKILLGRSKSGALSLTEDSVGLRFSCKLPNTTQAADLAESIQRGDLDGVSFGFTTDEDSWTGDGEGNVIRTLLAVTLFEISPCSFPAYPASSVSIRSCPSELRAKLKLTKRTNDEGCNCDCDSCLDDDCENCSMDDCDDYECAENGCPAQNGDDRSIRSLEDVKRYMRLQIALRK